MINPFHLLALSATSAYVLYPLIGLYFVLAAYTVLGDWPRAGDRQRIGLLWFIALPTTAFLALWLAGGVVLSLLLWLQWGDAGYYYGKWIAGVVAVIASAILLVRLATGWATRRYLRFNAWGAGLCAGLLGAMYFIHFAEGIDGWTARGAAENKFAYLMKGSEFYPPHLPRRIVDETTPSLAAHNGKAFAIYIGEARAAEIRVMPYYRWWWSVGYFRNFPFGEGLSIQEQVQKFHERLKEAKKVPERKHSGSH
jgi:hypothetical protein